jgi:hypothetical protein
MKAVNLPEDLEGPNDKFFTHPIVEWFLANAGTTETIDWKNVVDIKAKEKENKYKSYHEKLIAITETVISKGGRGYFWLVCSPKMSDVFRSMGIFTGEFFEQIPLGYPIVLYMGVLDKRWRVYSDMGVKDNVMLLGCCFSKKHNNYYCKINIENFK